MTREQAEQIATEAAIRLGRDWDALPAHSREIWIEAARNKEPWINKREQSEQAEPVEDEPEDSEADDQPKTKKRGKK